MERPPDSAFLAHRYNASEITAAMEAALVRAGVDPEVPRTLSQWDNLFRFAAQLDAIRARRERSRSVPEAHVSETRDR